MGVTIYARNELLQRVGGEVDDVQSLSVETPGRGVGSFSFTTALQSDKTKYLLADGAGVLILLDGDYLISGPIDPVSIDSSSGVERVTISGPSDSVLLSRRRAEPCRGL